MTENSVTSSDAVTVAIVEDDVDVRRYFGIALRPLGGTICEYQCQRDFIASLDRLAPDCAVVDLRLPDGDGLEIVRVIRDRRLPTSTLLVTGHANVRVTVDAMQGGVFDVLEKPIDSGHFLAAVRRGVELCRQRRMQFQQIADTERQLAQLSSGERQVLDLVLQGEPNKRIAKMLGLSQRTIESRRSEIYRKLEVDSVSTLVSKVLAAKRDAGSPPSET